jgi:S-adenosyl methyltransferase
MYDYYLGGKDNFAADRQAAERVLAVADVAGCRRADDVRVRRRSKAPAGHIHPAGDVQRAETRAKAGARLFFLFRGAEQLTNAVGVRDDVMDGRDAGKPGVRRYDRVRTRGVGRRGQNGVEGAESRSFLVQAQPSARAKARSAD